MQRGQNVSLRSSLSENRGGKGASGRGGRGGGAGAYRVIERAPLRSLVDHVRLHHRPALGADQIPSGMVVDQVRGLPERGGHNVSTREGWAGQREPSETGAGAGAGRGSPPARTGTWGRSARSAPSATASGWTSRRRPPPGAAPPPPPVLPGASARLVRGKE